VVLPSVAVQVAPSGMSEKVVEPSAATVPVPWAPAPVQVSVTGKIASPPAV